MDRVGVVNATSLDKGGQRGCGWCHIPGSQQILLNGLSLISRLENIMYGYAIHIQDYKTGV